MYQPTVQCILKVVTFWLQNVILHRYSVGRVGGDETVHEKALPVHKGDHLFPGHGLCSHKNHCIVNFFSMVLVPVAL